MSRRVGQALPDDGISCVGLASVVALFAFVLLRQAKPDLPCADLLVRLLEIQASTENRSDWPKN